MKKFLMCLTVMLSFFGINRVSAAEYIHSDVFDFSCNWYYVDYENVKNLGYENQLQEIYQMLIDDYKINYSTQYPYYYLHFVVGDINNCNQASAASSIGWISGFLNLYTDIPSFPLSDGEFVLRAGYSVVEKTYSTPIESNGYYYPWLFDSSHYNPLSYFTSNFDLVNNTQDTYVVTGNSNFTINPGDVIKPYYSSDNVFQDNYTEINLNDYAYVALALKDYNLEPFNTVMYFKGQICLTPVYDRGMNERKDILSGTKVKRCNPFYTDFTPVNISITSSDLKYYSIYYLKAYDSGRDNYIKVDNDVFDVTLISEEDKNNPYVYILDRYYPTIPYDSLTDSATISEDEGYIDGAVEEFDPIGTATDTWSEIIDNPIKALKEIWSSIVSIFDLIFGFYELLPTEMKTFLMSAFMIAVIIGLAKLVL